MKEVWKRPSICNQFVTPQGILHCGKDLTAKKWAGKNAAAPSFPTIGFGRLRFNIDTGKADIS
jgi:hypothetical protein